MLTSVLPCCWCDVVGDLSDSLRFDVSEDDTRTLPAEDARVAAGREH